MAHLDHELRIVWTVVCSCRSGTIWTDVPTVVWIVRKVVQPLSVWHPLHSLLHSQSGNTWTIGCTVTLPQRRVASPPWAVLELKIAPNKLHPTTLPGPPGCGSAHNPLGVAEVMVPTGRDPSIVFICIPPNVFIYIHIYWQARPLNS